MLSQQVCGYACLASPGAAPAGPRAACWLQGVLTLEAQQQLQYGQIQSAFFQQHQPIGGHPGFTVTGPFSMPQNIPVFTSGQLVHFNSQQQLTQPQLLQFDSAAARQGVHQAQLQQ